MAVTQTLQGFNKPLFKLQESFVRRQVRLITFAETFVSEVDLLTCEVLLHKS